MSIPAARLGDSFTDGDTIGEGSGNVFTNGIPSTYLTQKTLSHSCFPAVPIITGSGSTFINGNAAIRLSDLHAIHCDTLCKIGKNLGDDCHDGLVSSGSGNVFIG